MWSVCVCGVQNVCVWPKCVCVRVVKVCVSVCGPSVCVVKVCVCVCVA